MSKRSRSKANILVHRESIFWILSPVSCLLPKSPILPSLPGIHESIMQNKPNLPKAEMALNLCPKKHYGKTCPLRRRKNKANQTQFPGPKSSIVNHQ